MSRSSISSAFPDLNVWIALSSKRHAHHRQAIEWFRDVGDIRLFFCRFTQLGFLRLLTTVAVMGTDTLTQKQAWDEYDGWLGSGVATLIEEPAEFEQIFRSLTRHSRSSPKEWADSYLAAFTAAAGIRLVSFDQALAARMKGAILLRP